MRADYGSWIVSARPGPACRRSCSRRRGPCATSRPCCGAAACAASSPKMSFQGRRSKRLPLDVDSRSKAEGCKEDRVVRMATNPLVAVDATSSRLLERELLRSWGAYLADGRLEQVRVPIAESWRRSQALGVDPFTSRAPTLLAD